MNNFAFVFTFVEGLLTFVSPCILPLLPVYFVYLAGVSGSQSDNKVNRGKMFFNSLGFVLGFTVVFVLLGAVATSLGSFLFRNIDVFRKVSGVIVIILGLNFLGVFKIKFLDAQKRLNFQVEKLNFFTSIVFGMVFGFGWTPCLGAFLGAALALAGNSKTVLEGSLLLFVYSMGLGIPFILTAVVMDKTKKLLKAMQKHNKLINIISGSILILAGILIYTDSIKYLSNLSW